MKKSLFRSFINRAELCLAMALGLSLLANELSAATVTLGSDPSATLTGAVRYRNFNSGGGDEVRIGVPPLSTTFSTGDINWGSFPINKCVQFTYDGSGTLTTKIANVATPCSFVSPLATVSRSGLTLGTLNYLQFTITKNTQTTSAALNGVSLNADAFGNIAVISGTAGTTRWTVTGINLTNGFTLTAALAVAGSSGGGDSNNVQIDVGSVPPSDAEGPITSNVVVT